jgi:hypothetical protein
MSWDDWDAIAAAQARADQEDAERRERERQRREARRQGQEATSEAVEPPTTADEPLAANPTSLHPRHRVYEPPPPKPVNPIQAIRDWARDMLASLPRRTTDDRGARTLGRLTGQG